MDKNKAISAIEAGKSWLGIELGSTRIKAMLIGEDHSVLAAGGFDWENSLVDGLWTYSLELVWEGMRSCFAELAKDVQDKYGVKLTKLGGMGVSAMMHGYLPFDKDGNQISMFRTWRNTNTGEAVEELSALFNFNIPHRWSVSHLYQYIIEKQEHLEKLDFFTTLAGYVHWQLTGKKVIGIGDASGMFPIDSNINDYDRTMTAAFDKAAAKRGFNKEILSLLPKVLCAGEEAGCLTKEGALLLDPTGTLLPGVPLCPPEGDAGTGMAATNSVLKRTGNVSAGTSIFAMVVLEKALSRPYPEIDMVTTPSGSPVAMVHCNNCSSDIDAWAGLFHEFAAMAGVELPFKKVLDMLFFKALEGDPDCGGIMAYNFFSGEPVARVEEGRPMVIRTPDAKFNVANFMRAHLQTALSTLKIGLDIMRSENVVIDRMYGHGGYFKAKGVGQKLMAAAIDAPVYVMQTAGEGGAWGAALLAAYMTRKAEGQSLGDYLAKEVFAGDEGEPINPDEKDVAGFESFMKSFLATLPAERLAGGNENA